MGQRAYAALRPSDVRTRLRALEDREVIEIFVAGDERAFTEIYERYKTRIMNFIWRTIGDKERAEDLLQETLIRIYRHAWRFDNTKKFSTWIFTIAHNLAKNELRNRSRDPLVLFQTMRSAEEEDDRPLQFEDLKSRPDDMYRKRHLRLLVNRAVASLPEHHRQVFILREMEGKTYEDISEIIHCNLGTVKSRLNRARTAFAAIIEPALG